MDIFSRHELIKTQDGYTLVFYVEKQTSEFAEDFLCALDSKRKELQKDTLDYIKNYINENYRGIKIDTVKIMLGSLLVASIAYNPVDAYAPSTIPTNQAQLTSSITYTVKPGDTLYSISTKTGVTVELLKKLNNLTTNTIYPGQLLKTQDQPDSYIVKTGDTLFSISKNYNISIAKLKEINKLSGDVLYPGQKLNFKASPPPAAVADNLVLVNKTHSLPAGYAPKNLVNPKVPTVNRSKTMMTPEAARALEGLFAKARQDNIPLSAISGYRSYERQNEIFASNVKKYGSAAAANRFSAKPGQSEHQTGLAMDVSSPSVNYSLTQSYAQTREGKWLKENAPKYGFIVRYPKGKENITGYLYEPWHIRYVGKGTSQEIASRNITLEEYLGKI
jgi:LAS superfamily LD-carboxypeptidase LdcB